MNAKVGMLQVGSIVSKHCSDYPTIAAVEFCDAMNDLVTHIPVVFLCDEPWFYRITQDPTRVH